MTDSTALPCLRYCDAKRYDRLALRCVRLSPPGRLRRRERGRCACPAALGGNVLPSVAIRNESSKCSFTLSRESRGCVVRGVRRRRGNWPGATASPVATSSASSTSPFLSPPTWCGDPATPTTVKFTATRPADLDVPLDWAGQRAASWQAEGLTQLSLLTKCYRSATVCGYPC